jgi:lipopolysaccharide export LptBFGC system permease protein LptF
MPIAALFATTIVYGRFSADNEVTACRAAGISYLAMTVPAFVLGIITAFISIGLLSFVVPASMLRVEQIVFSNIAQLAVSQVERTHQIRFGDERPLTVFAQSAQALPPDPKNPTLQTIRFNSPVIAEYEDRDRRSPLVPKNFYMASSAIAYINGGAEGEDLELTVHLIGGSKFPRTPGGNADDNITATVGSQGFGPLPLPSQVKENTKFMDVRRLRMLYDHPELSRRIINLLRSFVRRDQETGYLQFLAAQLKSPAGMAGLDGREEKYSLVRGGGSIEINKDGLIVNGVPGNPAKLIQTAGPGKFSAEGAQIKIRAYPDRDGGVIGLGIELLDARITTDKADTPRRSLTHPVTVAMPPSIADLASRPIGAYVKGALNDTDKLKIERERYKLVNSIISELHARMSFALSCLILVMVGCALGMMFRSGNFLSAFAVSVIPALLSIALIVTGQHTCENVPSPLPPDWTNSLQLGLSLIWSGNAAVLVIAVILLGRLQRR